MASTVSISISIPSPTPFTHHHLLPRNFSRFHSIPPLHRMTSLSCSFSAKPQSHPVQQFSQGRDEDDTLPICPGCGVLMQTRHPNILGFFQTPTIQTPPTDVPLIDSGHAFEAGKPDTLLHQLRSITKRKEVEIEDLCKLHYEDFILAIYKLRSVLVDADELQVPPQHEGDLDDREEPLHVQHLHPVTPALLDACGDMVVHPDEAEVWRSESMMVLAAANSTRIQVMKSSRSSRKKVALDSPNPRIQGTPPPQGRI